MLEGLISNGDRTGLFAGTPGLFCGANGGAWEGECVSTISGETSLLHSMIGIGLCGKTYGISRYLPQVDTMYEVV